MRDGLQGLVYLPFNSFPAQRMTKPGLLELPPGVQLVYLAEGAANVVYRFVASPANSAFAVKKDSKRLLASAAVEGIEHCSVPARLRGKLLRLRKETASDVHYEEIARNFDTIIRPLFNPKELVDQTLIRLPEGLIQHCNEQLRIAELNGLRPTQRHGAYLCVDEPFGLLVTDMTTAGDPRATLAEFKPKWLIQSPSAPPTSQRCRTCALREMKNHEARSLGQKEQLSFCPLDLVSERFDNVLRATDFIKGGRDHARLARILYQNPTLRKLQAHQKAIRDVGLRGPSEQSREASLAMTLRDCTMFIKIPHDEKSATEIRLGDLDLKTGDGGKAEYWLDLETQLIDEDWYLGSNSGQELSECALQSARRHPLPST